MLFGRATGRFADFLPRIRRNGICSCAGTAPRHTSFSSTDLETSQIKAGQEQHATSCAETAKRHELHDVFISDPPDATTLPSRWLRTARTSESIEVVSCSLSASPAVWPCIYCSCDILASASKCTSVLYRRSNIHREFQYLFYSVAGRTCM